MRTATRDELFAFSLELQPLRDNGERALTRRAASVKTETFGCDDANNAIAIYEIMLQSGDLVMPRLHLKWSYFEILVKLFQCFISHVTTRT